MLALTNGFSSHPATTALSRGAANQAILLQTSGALIEKDFTVPGEKPKRTIIIRSMSEAWLDSTATTPSTRDREARPLPGGRRDRGAQAQEARRHRR
jgi:hypothetical protein